MLKRVVKKTIAGGGDYIIIASLYNRRFVDSMVKAAREFLVNAKANSIEVIRVPGAYEIPVVVSNLIKNRAGKITAIICLGVIIRGETAHAQLIGEAVTFALTKMQIESGIPIIHEVLLLENPGQAKKRCLDPEHNRGYEAAKTAVEMGKILKSISEKS
ncbi:MAG: 6,7-dimethyl-8-ribityllumazine synthase [Verrucomicrobiia bacterium]